MRLLLLAFTAALAAPAQSLYPPTHWLIPKQNDPIDSKELDAIMEAACDGEATSPRFARFVRFPSRIHRIRAGGVSSRDRSQGSRAMTCANACENGFDKWVFPLYGSIMTTKLILDRAGRVLIPKTLRQELHLGPGDTLQLESEGDEITLRPLRPKALLKKEHGVWVCQGEPCDASITDLIDRHRESHIREQF